MAEKSSFTGNISNHYAKLITSTAGSVALHDNGSVEKYSSQAGSMLERQPGDSPSTPVIRHVESTRIVRRKNLRAQVDKLAISKSNKEFRNQMLKDKGTWSYDWRTPLRDLEEHFVAGQRKDAEKALAPSFQGKIEIQHNVPANEIPRPSAWTERSFHAYVAQLASSKVDRLVARRIYPRGTAHDDIVAEILIELFADENLRYAVSITAGNIALRFFFSHGKFARGRNLFDRLQELQKTGHSSPYNIMLRAAADQKDLFTFTTWIYLAQAVQDDEVRMKIIERMSEKGLLRNPGMLQSAVAVLMPQIMTAHFHSKKDHQSLLEALDSRYGSHWCSGPSCERIVDEVGVRQSIQEALVVLKKLHKRGYQPTQGMLLLLLRQCPWTSAHRTTTEILRLFREDYGVNPSRPIYDVLFKQAWRSRLHNCCRVIWMHACVTGHTSFNMQETVKQSLYDERGSKPEAKSLLPLWEELAGKIITGHGANNNLPRFLFLVSLWKPANENLNDRDRYLRAVKSILEGDLAAVGQYEAAKPLDDLLSEALATDERWTAGRVLRSIPIECKYSQLIDVGLVPAASLKQESLQGLYVGESNESSSQDFPKSVSKKLALHDAVEEHLEETDYQNLNSQCSLHEDPFHDI
ncbi:MAG: hypothetical protein Q9220_002152 [cf. Caloplaca sp. 1 TL-2023]